MHVNLRQLKLEYLFLTSRVILRVILPDFPLIGRVDGGRMDDSFKILYVNDVVINDPICQWTHGNILTHEYFPKDPLQSERDSLKPGIVRVQRYANVFLSSDKKTSDLAIRVACLFVSQDILRQVAVRINQWGR